MVELKKYIMRVGAICTSAILFGCGSSAPEDIAQDFARALSDIDISIAKEKSSDSVHKKLVEFKKICKRSEVEEVSSKAFNTLNIIGKKLRDSKYKKDIQKAVDKYRDEIGLLQKKYDNSKKENIDEFMKNALVIGEQLIEKEADVLDIDIDDKRINTIISGYVMAMGEANVITRVRKFRVHPNNVHAARLRGVAKKILTDIPEKITKKCVKKYTDFGEIDDINFIETKNESPDEARVRLEIIHDDGKAKKVSVRVEKIKNEWKVSRLPLNIDFW